MQPLPSARYDHAAVPLPDGRVLLVGGRTNEAPELNSTLIWEPETRSFREGPPLREARSHPVAVTLPDGAVLVLGSEFDDDMQRGTRAELLRPGARAWEPAGQTVHIFHVGPVCVSGQRVVIAGGRDNGFGFAIIDGVHYAPPLAQSTEIWEHGGRAWRAATGPLLEPRDDPAGVTLSDGSILVVGGWHEGQVLTSAEQWDPNTERWSPAGSLSIARSSFTLTALPDGRAAVSGGLGQGPFEEVTAVELWDPQRRVWSPGTPLAQGRAGHKVVPVDAGTFLVVGNSRPTPEAPPETTWEVWRPAP
ncbi:Kelch repeat-containing protein [Hyalangium versicolor]|uniref:Kelch repeat-containing protein n=1 Tax=Hyalangium versicolor TaxID=2861190 RepID=UPI001CCE3103|nr:kelch repeat-containing protein [Hyalangium versicolor]